MRINNFIFAASAFAVVVMCTPKSASAIEMSANEIMKRNYFVTKVASLSASASMSLHNAAGDVRKREMVILSKLQDNGQDSNLMIRFNTPADIRGTSFLQIEHSTADDDLWIYLPALKKSRRLVSNNKKDSFVGTDFAYGDILPPRPELYRHRLVRSEMLDGQDCHLIETMPMDEAVRQSSGYSRKLTWVDKRSFLEAKVEYYDEQDRLLKTQTIKQPQLVDKVHNLWLAGQREMINHRSEHKTIFQLTHIEVGRFIQDSSFTTRSIERE